MTLRGNRLPPAIMSDLRRLPAALCAVVMLLIGGCSEDGETPVVAEDLAEMDADNVVYGMRQVLSREGVREAIVRADTAYFYEDSAAVHLRGVQMTLFREGGEERAEVEAERGRLATSSQNMVGRGNVILTIPEGNRRIETEVLNYSASDDRIWSDTATVMVEDGQVTCGAAFRSDLEFRDVVIDRARTADCEL